MEFLLTKSRPFDAEDAANVEVDHAVLPLAFEEGSVTHVTIVEARR